MNEFRDALLALDNRAFGVSPKKNNLRVIFQASPVVSRPVLLLLEKQ